MTFLDSFRNKSGKPQSIWTKVGTHAQLKGRQSSQNFRRDRLSGYEMGRGGARTCARCRGFFCKQYQTTFRQLCNSQFSPNLARTCESVMKCRFWTEIYEKFQFRGHLLPKTPNLEGVKQALHSQQATGQGMYCREILFTPSCSPRAREFTNSQVGQLFLYDVRLRSYGAPKLPNFRTLTYFPHTAYSPGVTLQNDSDFFM